MISTETKNKAYFEENGYLPPQEFINENKAEYYKNKFFESIDQTPDNPQKTEINLDAYHQKHDWALKLATEKSILDSVSEILESDDILLWAMHFWYKEPNYGKFIPWHQDAYYWQFEPQINVTAWIALDYCFDENGCLRIIPGTHKTKFKHFDDDREDNIFKTEVNVNDIENYEVKSLSMNPGQFVLFNENTLHSSKKNTSKMARIACSCRFTVPSVKFNFKPDDHRISIKVVRGEDNFKLNEQFKRD